VLELDAAYIRERIASLCMEKGISEYTLSLALGLNKSYINKITRGKALPSMSIFLQICEYFEISPSEFFNEAMAAPFHTAELMRTVSKLTAEQIGILDTLAKQMEK